MVLVLSSHSSFEFNAQFVRVPRCSSFIVVKWAGFSIRRIIPIFNLYVLRAQQMHLSTSTIPNIIETDNFSKAMLHYSCFIVRSFLPNINLQIIFRNESTDWMGKTCRNSNRDNLISIVYLHFDRMDFHSTVYLTIFVSIFLAFPYIMKFGCLLIIIRSRKSEI